MECTNVFVRESNDGGEPPPSNGGGDGGGIGQFLRDRPLVTATGVIGLGAVVAGIMEEEDGR